MINAEKWTGRVVKSFGENEVANVHVLQLPGEKPRLVEFVDSLDPRYSRREKWCLNVSTQAGCPVACLMCDAGGDYRGNLSKDEILEQIGRILAAHTDDGSWRARKIKLHFARMGEPAMNPAVLEVLRHVAINFPSDRFIPAIATTAPRVGQNWLNELKSIKNEYYRGGRFQLQFSVNSSDEAMRDRLMPVSKLSLPELSQFAAQWFEHGDRRISLNFALGRGIPVDPEIIASHFSPENSLIKLTPINPTARSTGNGIETVIAPERPEAAAKLVLDLETKGFEVIVSIGDPKEIKIGSNCGQAARWVAEMLEKQT